MANYTEHHKLKKPLQEEFYNIDDHNRNMDIIDAELKRLGEEHSSDMDDINKALDDVDKHIKDTNNPHKVTAEQVGAQAKNNNLTEYRNGILQTISGTEVKISSIEISSDEPAEGDVWIDTDDDDGEGSGAVESVNGKTGHVNLTAQDVDAYPTGQTYTKTEVNARLYTHPSTHPASMIEETDALKIMTKEEREKLAGIEAQANKYTHPSTHPASMITGLADVVSGLGYTKIARGTFTGNSNAEGSLSTSKTVTLPFSPSMVIFGTAGVSFKNAYGTHFVVLQGKTVYNGASTLATLSDTKLTIKSSNASGHILLSSDYTYFWIAIA